MNGSREIVGPRRGKAPRQRLPRVSVGSRDQASCSLVHDPLGDPHDLLDRLPGREDDLGVSLAQRAVVIDGREIQRLGGSKGQLGQRGCRLRRTGCHALEHGEHVVARHALTVSSSESRSGTATKSPRPSR
jgi:hypothetical protein